MSLLITSNTPKNDFATEVKGFNRPYSYTNHLNDTTKIPAFSKIAVESLKMNKSGNISINRGTQFAVYFGEVIGDDETSDDVLSVSAPTYILENSENNFTGNIENIAAKIQVAGNRALWHPNLCETTNGSNPGFICEPLRNASNLDFEGFKFKMTNIDETQNASFISDNWIATDHIADNAAYNTTTRILTNNTNADRAFVGTKYPLSLANGSFSCSIQPNASTSLTEIGLCRYLAIGEDGFSMKQIHYSSETAMDYFDYMFAIDTGGDISLFHSFWDGNTYPPDLSLQEVDYGASLNAKTDKIDRVTFNVKGEQVSVIAFNSASNITHVLANGQNANPAKNLKPICQTTRWLYPKIFLEDTKTIGIRDFFGVDVKDLDYLGLAKNFIVDEAIAKKQLGLDWWKYVIEENPTSLLEQATLLDISNTKMRSRINQLGLNLDLQIDYSPCLVTAPHNKYVLTQSCNTQDLFGFKNRSFISLPNSTLLSSPYTLTFNSDKPPAIKATNSLFVRLNNFGHQTINFAKSSTSKIIYHVPSFANNGESTGALFFNPSERVYIDLNNPQDLFISDIKLDIVHDDETLATELQGKTTIVLHIIQ
jgi:hypothetical protein